MASSIALLLLSYLGPKLVVKFGGGIVARLALKGITAAVQRAANAPPPRPLTAEEKTIVEADRARMRQDIGGPMDH